MLRPSTVTTRDGDDDDPSAAAPAPAASLVFSSTSTPRAVSHLWHACPTYHRRFAVGRQCAVALPPGLIGGSAEKCAGYSDAKVCESYGMEFGWEVAHEAIS
jgi:hypothetical protein